MGAESCHVSTFRCVPPCASSQAVRCALVGVIAVVTATARGPLNGDDGNEEEEEEKEEEEEEEE